MKQNLKMTLFFLLLGRRIYFQNALPTTHGFTQMKESAIISGRKIKEFLAVNVSRRSRRFTQI